MESSLQSLLGLFSYGWNLPSGWKICHLTESRKNSLDLASLWWVPRVFWGPRRALAARHHNGIKWGGTLIIFSSSLCPWSPLLPAHLVPFTDPVPHSLGTLLLDFPSFPAPFPLSLPPCCRCSKIRVMSDGHLGCPWLPSFDSAHPQRDAASAFVCANHLNTRFCCGLFL